MRTWTIPLLALLLITLPACSLLIDTGESPVAGDGGDDGTDDGEDDGGDTLDGGDGLDGADATDGEDGGDAGDEDDPDGDGILTDGDGNGFPGDHPCIGGATEDCDDNCPNLANSDQADDDADGVGNVCDNCPDTYNPDQLDRDNSTVGDACDPVPISDIQTNVITGGQVLIENVLVSTYMVRSSGAAVPDTYWVQAPDSGPTSGIRVHDPNLEAGVLFGWQVNIGGTVHEDAKDNAYIELDTIEPVDFAPEARVTALFLADLGTLATLETAEDYEGMVVQIDDVAPTAAVTSGQEFVIGPAGGGTPLVQVGNRFADFYDFSMQQGDSFTSLAGVLEQRDAGYVIQPRFCSDIIIEDDSACTCWLPLHSVSQIQDRNHAQRLYQGCTVGIESLYVTATGPRGVYVQDQSPAAAYGGILISGSNLTNLLVGNVITIDEGTYVESQGESEIIEAGATITNPDQTEVQPRDLDLADLANGNAVTESWEGTLVRVLNVEVTQATSLDPDGADRGAFEILPIGMAEAVPLVVGWRFQHHWACPAGMEDHCNGPQVDHRTLGQEFDSITGILAFDHGRYQLMPRNCQDLIGGDGLAVCSDSD